MCCVCIDVTFGTTSIRGFLLLGTPKKFINITTIARHTLDVPKSFSLWRWPCLPKPNNGPLLYCGESKWRKFQKVAMNKTTASAWVLTTKKNSLVHIDIDTKNSNVMQHLPSECVKLHVNPRLCLLKLLSPNTKKAMRLPSHCLPPVP